MFLLNRVALGLMLRPKAKQPDHKSETRAAVKTVSRSPELEVSFTGRIWANWDPGGPGWEGLRERSPSQ